MCFNDDFDINSYSPFWKSSSVCYGYQSNMMVSEIVLS